MGGSDANRDLERGCNVKQMQPQGAIDGKQGKLNAQRLLLPQLSLWLSLHMPLLTMQLGRAARSSSFWPPCA